MKNSNLLEQYLENEEAHCPRCNEIIRSGNKGKCSGCGESIELTIKTKPHLSYYWKTGFWYGGVPVGLIFIIGLFLGISMILGLLKYVEIL